MRNQVNGKIDLISSELCGSAQLSVIIALLSALQMKITNLLISLQQSPIMVRCEWRFKRLMGTQQQQQRKNNVSPPEDPVMYNRRNVIISSSPLLSTIRFKRRISNVASGS